MCVCGMYVCIYAFMHACMHACRDREKERERERERESKRQSQPRLRKRWAPSLALDSWPESLALALAAVVGLKSRSPLKEF